MSAVHVVRADGIEPLGYRDREKAVEFALQVVGAFEVLAGGGLMSESRRELLRGLLEKGSSILAGDAIVAIETLEVIE